MGGAVHFSNFTNAFEIFQSWSRWKWVFLRWTSICQRNCSKLFSYRAITHISCQQLKQFPVHSMTPARNRSEGARKSSTKVSRVKKKKSHSTNYSLNFLITFKTTTIFARLRLVYFLPSAFHAHSYFIFSKQFTLWNYCELTLMTLQQ